MERAECGPLAETNRKKFRLSSKSQHGAGLTAMTPCHCSAIALNGRKNAFPNEERTQRPNWPRLTRSKPAVAELTFEEKRTMPDRVLEVPLRLLRTFRDRHNPPPPGSVAGFARL